MTAPIPAYAIEAEGLSKTYAASGKSPAKQALIDLSLRVPVGSVFGLLGPNGAGKSTFINILAGLVTKTAGTARVWGYDVAAQSRQARAAIGIVPQEINFDAFFTPFEALELQAGFYGVPKAERRTDDLLAALGLADKRNSYARTLSGGMKRRLLVGKAMVHNPPILVLDEPTAGVDVDLRRQLWDYVRGLNRAGVTVMLTTHYLEEAQELCDTIAIINKGRLVALEPTAQLLRRLDYKTLIVQPETSLDVAPATLPGCEAQIRPDGALSITFRAGSVRVEDVLDALRAADIRIKDLRTEEPDLEDVFVELTR